MVSLPLKFDVTDACGLKHIRINFNIQNVYQFVMCLPEVEKSAHVQLSHHPAIGHPLGDVRERALLVLVPSARRQDPLERTTHDAIQQGDA